MMNQTAPIVATAMIQSLCIGGISYLLLGLLLFLLRKIKSIYKYHVGNIAIFVSFIAFIQPLLTIPAVWNTAPVHTPALPIGAHEQITTAPYVIAQVTATPAPDFSPEQAWRFVYDRIIANSNTILLLYLVGLLFFATRLLLQYLQSRRMKTKETVPANEQWTGLLASTKELLNIRANIAIAFTHKQISPCIIGHAKAIILIPIAIANNLTTEQAEAILLHELAHYRQYDYYINLVTQCINCLLFFNPFTWLITKLCDRYREEACDAAATRYDRNIELAETLAMIAGMHTVENRLSLNLKKRSPLLSRIQALLNRQPDPKKSPRLLPVALVTIVMATVLILAGSTELFSKGEDKLRTQLQEISREMYDEGNEKYIFVDAVLDSLINLPIHAEMTYMGSQYMHLSTNKKFFELKSDLKQKYLSKLQDFLVTQGEDKEAVVTFSTGVDKQQVTLEDILNSSSSFRQSTVKDKYRAGITTRAWNTIFDEIIKDGLPANINNDYELVYGPQSISINGNTLRDEQNTKYRLLFSEVLGLDLDKDNISGRMNMKSLVRRQFDMNGGAATENNEFAVISQLLFNEGRIEYLVVDAVQDGILKDEENFTLLFTDSAVRFKGKYLTKRQQQKYDEKFRQYVNYYRNPYCYGNVSNTVHYADIENPGSGFRNGMYLFKERGEYHAGKMAIVYKELQKDGLIDTNYQTALDYQDYDKVYINYELLKGAKAYKYSELIKDAYPQMSPHGENSFSLVWNSQKPLPQVRGNGKELMEYQRLSKISNEMYIAGNSNYIIVNAVRDGLLKDGEPYDMNYENNVVNIKGKKLTPTQQRDYNERFTKFLKMHGKINGLYEWSGTSIEMSDILNPNSSIRERNSNSVLMPGTADTYTDYIINEMQKDGLVDTSLDLRVEYSPRGLFINDKIQTGKVVTKYGAMFRKFDPTLGVTKKTSFAYTHSRTDEQLPDDATLRGESERLYRSGKQGYVIIDAIRDGYLKEGDAYTIDYTGGVFSITGKKMPANVRERYERKLRAFNEMHADSVHEGWKISSTVQELSTSAKWREQFNIQISKPPKADKEKEAQQKEENRQLQVMLGALHKEGLLDSSGYYKIEGRNGHVYVNAIELEGATEKKYARMIEQMGYHNNFSTERIPDGVAVPDWKSGNSTIHLYAHGYNLPAIAQKMFVDGNPNFILAYALKDGLIKEGWDGQFAYEATGVSIDNKKIKEPYQSDYSKKMKSFFLAHAKDMRAYAVNGTVVSKKLLNDVESEVRTARVRR